jgi:uncharacterized protein (TIGR03437 family)
MGDSVEGQSFCGRVRPAVVPSVPGIFTKTQTGTGQAAALNQDGSPNSEANPAARGSTVSLFATGEGQTYTGGRVWKNRKHRIGPAQPRRHSSD